MGTSANSSVHAVGVAVARALSACGVERVQVKWPNDVVVDFRKLAGILAEIAAGARHVRVAEDRIAGYAAALGKPVVTLPIYRKETDARFVLFCDYFKGTPDPYRGVQVTTGGAAYVLRLAGEVDHFRGRELHPRRQLVGGRRREADGPPWTCIHPVRNARHGLATCTSRSRASVAARSGRGSSSRSHAGPFP